MTSAPAVASVLLAAGTVSMAIAVVHERSDLFTDVGLRLQRRASTFGIAGAALWLLGVVAWAMALATSQG